MKKYELTNETEIIGGRTLFRIRALKDFRNVRVGDLGGYIEKEDNLAQDDNSWIYEGAAVYGNAIVRDFACVADDARVYDNAIVCDDACIYGKAKVYDNAKVCDRVHVHGESHVHGNATVSGVSIVSGSAIIRDNAKVCEHALVAGDAYVCEDAVVCSNVSLKNGATVCSNALIRSAFDYTVIEGFGVMDEPITFFRKADNSIGVGSVLFYDSIGDFIADIKQKYGDSKYAKEYLQIANLMECHFREE